MMRQLSSLLTCAALTLTAGLLGCTPDIGDPFTTLTSPTTVGDGDGDTGDGDNTGETGDDTGDGDGDPTGDGDGDPTGDGDGDACGFGCPCATDEDCDDDLFCGDDGTCGLTPATGDGDGDGDNTDPPVGNGNYDPALCADPAIIIGVTGLDGIFCSDPCMTDDMCASVAPGQGACALISDGGMNATNCALLCDASNPDPAAACPEGASCQPIPMQDPTGICTWPEP